MEWEEFILLDWSPSDNPVQSERAKRASSSIMECEEIILQDWSPPDIPIQSERAKRASSSIMECEEFILPDWSPPDDPASDDDDRHVDFDSTDLRHLLGGGWEHHQVRVSPRMRAFVLECNIFTFYPFHHPRTLFWPSS